MNDNIYLKEEKQTSRKQQIRARLALLNDELNRLYGERIEVINTMSKLRDELASLD